MSTIFPSSPYHIGQSLCPQNRGKINFVERASKDSRIVPGDVLGSGTVSGGSIPEAIARGIESARYLQPGDVVELEVEGIGTLRNTLGPKNPDPDYRYKPK